MAYIEESRLHVCCFFKYDQITSSSLGSRDLRMYGVMTGPSL
jgi:hypothetical protein